METFEKALGLFQTKLKQLRVKKETRGFLYVPATTTNPQPKQIAPSNPDFSFRVSHPLRLYLWHNEFSRGDKHLVGLKIALIQLD